jgi:hypothetical protein
MGCNGMLNYRGNIRINSKLCPRSRTTNTCIHQVEQMPLTLAAVHNTEMAFLPVPYLMPGLAHNSHVFRICPFSIRWCEGCQRSSWQRRGVSDTAIATYQSMLSSCYPSQDPVGFPPVVLLAATAGVASEKSGVLTLQTHVPFFATIHLPANHVVVGAPSL